MAKVSKAAIGMGAIIAFAGVVTVIYTFPGASNQGYAPEQPIPFSHRLHAGQYKIDCQYCHVGVTKSAHATVPAENVCMNCHRVVKTDSPHIQNLWKHYQEGRPIEWVRIHSLPDHAKFAHYRHVNKGVQCQTCHGPIQEMDRVSQASPLTMGWCLECHRNQTTPKYIVEKMNGDRDSKDPVAPTSCSACHY